MQIDFIHAARDPDHAKLLERLNDILHELKQVATIRTHDIKTARHGDLWRHLGAPSIAIDGIDLQGRRARPGGPERRWYEGQPVPPDWMIEAAILRASHPTNILFMCVANSARSQMAEGIASWLAPPGVEVWSAGSAPTRINPLAVQVLSEVGIDISHHHAKGGDSVPVGKIDALVTLCTDEYCPTIPGLRLRLHWALPDPAAVQGDEEARLTAFRGVRDILTRRLETMFRCWGGNCERADDARPRRGGSTQP